MELLFLCGFLDLFEDSLHPFLDRVAILAGDQTLIHDDVRLKLVALLELGPDLLQLLLQEERQSLVQLHVLLLLGGVARDGAVL